MMDSQLDEVENTMNNGKDMGIKFWAMQLFASGKKDFESFSRGLKLKEFEGLVYGTSNKERVVDFADKLKSDGIMGS